MDDFRPGDIIIDECVLQSIDGQYRYDIKKQAQMINIYESVLQPIIYAEIQISDAIGLLKGFPIIGEEVVSIKITTPTFNTLTYKLNVFAIENINQTQNNKITSYTLKLCSPEAMNNAVCLITKRFKAQISSSIKNIVTHDLKSKKKINIEATQGIDEHLITNLTPFQAIDKLRHRAVSSRNASSSYVFFENAAGFHFTTLEQLIRNGKTQKIDKVYFSDDNRDVEQSQVRFRDILAYDQLQSQNTISKLQAGSERNIVNKFDLLTGNIKKVEYNSTQFEDLFAATGDISSQHSSKFAQKYSKTTSRKFLVPYTSELDESFIGDKVGRLHSFIDKITQNLMQFHVYGDTSLSLGQVIACNFTESNAFGEESKVKQVSNNYLITKIRHMIVMAERPFYSQSLECINNSCDY